MDIECEAMEEKTERSFNLVEDLPPEIASKILGMLDHVSLRSASLVNYRWYCFCQSDSGLRAKYFDHLRKHFRPRTGKRVAVYRNLRVSTSTTAGRPVSITSQPGTSQVAVFTDNSPLEINVGDKRKICIELLHSHGKVLCTSCKLAKNLNHHLAIKKKKDE